METSEQACRTYFDFLKRHYRLNNWRSIDLILHVHEVEMIHWPHRNMHVWGFTNCVKNKAEIHVATKRGIVEVYKTIGHEYKHCLQNYNDGTWIDKGLVPSDSPLEVEANLFAEEAFAEFLRMYAPQVPCTSSTTEN